MDAIETVRNLEAELATRKKEASKLLAAQRAVLGMSLRDVAKKVRLSAVAVYNIETGKSWKTKTAAKIGRFYQSAA